MRSISWTLGVQIIRWPINSRAQAADVQHYDVKLDPDWLRERTGAAFTHANIVRLDNSVEPRIMQELYTIAAEMAGKEERPEDFPASFNHF